ncbi:hypothetical protein [Rhizobium sp. C4]|uniref:hypothetical protein n=1 Tax=Rhizobium sp. C4 TaxID=1349800 RepID=UPI001E4F427F|nr:hypothetical protein [Rhizobium sp. C4]MCD2171356.1 hypothetical protein [Rhizobium sp. C4]
MLSCSMLLAGCMSTDVANNTPTPAGMNNSGVYPYVGEKREVATTQMSDAEAASIGTKLQALADQRKAGKVSEADYNRKVEEMRKLNTATQAAAKADAPASN